LHTAAPPPGYCLRPGEELREYMRRSIFLAAGGREPERGRPLAAVGDYTASHLLRRGYRPHLIVVDCVVERRSVDCLQPPPGYRVARASNPRGCITWSAWRIVAEAWRGPPTIIYVDGEDDLVAIPVIIEAPDDAVVAYGIPWAGMATVEAAWGRTLAEYISRSSTLEYTSTDHVIA